MIQTAKEVYPDATFLHQDMISHLQDLEQQSIDIILCLASFHHLTNKHDRLLALHNMYRSLSYGGIAILINRSFSDRFLKKYYPSLIKACWKSIITLGQRKRNDLLIPRKDPQYQDNKKTYDRYYHMFSLSELRNLLRTSDFSVIKSTYIDQQGQETDSWKDSRNSILILQK